MTSIKRRRGGYKRSKAGLKKNKKQAHTGGRTMPHIADDKIRKNWDKTKTLAQNYANLGLAGNVNQDLSSNYGAISSKILYAPQVDEVNAQVDAHLNQLKEDMSLPPVPYKIKSMSVREQKILQNLRTKFGDDLNAMAKDTKINVDQKTKAQLVPRFELYDYLQSL